MKVIIDSESPLECEEQTENFPTHSGDIQWCKDQVTLLTIAALIVTLIVALTVMAANCTIIQRVPA